MAEPLLPAAAPAAEAMKTGPTVNIIQCICRGTNNVQVIINNPDAFPFDVALMNVHFTVDYDSIGDFVCEILLAQGRLCQSRCQKL